MLKLTQPLDLNMMNDNNNYNNDQDYIVEEINEDSSEKSLEVSSSNMNLNNYQNQPQAYPLSSNLEDKYFKLNALAMVSSERLQEENNKRMLEESETKESNMNKKRKFVTLEPKILEIQHSFQMPSQAPNIEHFRKQMDAEEIDKFTKKNTLLTDITCLLNLPQKLAALKLDMSESMLCKKFKETVNKKWPFRQIQKIEREIAATENKSEIDRLIEKRNQNLYPVSIYLRRFHTQEEVDKYMNDKINKSK